MNPVNLLQRLIAIPSLSTNEGATADLIVEVLESHNILVNRVENNLWAVNKYISSSKETLLLNSHHDTVKPNSKYTRSPYEPQVVDGKMYGLGSNDAGGALVCLLAVFLDLYDKDLPFNVAFAASGEEEISGANGMELLVTELPKIDYAIVGEPTLMQMAIAEKGLMVLDCIAHGKAGHAARNEGENAIYFAMKDIAWFENYEFERKSELLGPVKMSVTQIEAGSQHNVVPEVCSFVVDVRTTDVYTNDEIIAEIEAHVNCEVIPRSRRLQPSGISQDHPLVKSGLGLNLITYGSPTLSDQSLMPWPSLKLGPGDSARSHTADEFIFIKELEEGVAKYTSLINELVNQYR